MGSKSCCFSCSQTQQPPLPTEQSGERCGENDTTSGACAFSKKPYGSSSAINSSPSTAGPCTGSSGTCWGAGMPAPKHWAKPVVKSTLAMAVLNYRLSNTTTRSIPPLPIRNISHILTLSQWIKGRTFTSTCILSASEMQWTETKNILVDYNIKQLFWGTIAALKKVVCCWNK